MKQNSLCVCLWQGQKSKVKKTFLIKKHKKLDFRGG